MNTETKQLLLRWQSLEKDGGLRRAGLIAGALRIAGLALGVFIAFAVVRRLDPLFIVPPAAVIGWMAAEANALRTRIAQWPIFKNYIDWKKVEEDLRG
jgi:hypothetical protein